MIVKTNLLEMSDIVVSVESLLTDDVKSSLTSCRCRWRLAKCLTVEKYDGRVTSEKKKEIEVKLNEKVRHHFLHLISLYTMAPVYVWLFKNGDETICIWNFILNTENIICDFLLKKCLKKYLRFGLILIFLERSLLLLSVFSWNRIRLSLLSRVTNTIGCCQSSRLKQELPPPLISKTFLQPWNR